MAPGPIDPADTDPISIGPATAAAQAAVAVAEPQIVVVAEPEVVPEFETHPIHVARLPENDGSVISEPPQPPALVLVPSHARDAPPLKAGAAVLLVVILALASAVIASSSTTASHSPVARTSVFVRLTPSEQRVVAAAQARAAAIAKAKRDRGTDAELEDTIPPAPPAPTHASAKAVATVRPGATR